MRADPTHRRADDTIPNDPLPVHARKPRDDPHPPEHDPEPRRPRPRHRWSFEQLEDRTLLATVPGADLADAIPLTAPSGTDAGTIAPGAPVFFRIVKARTELDRPTSTATATTTSPSPDSTGFTVKARSMCSGGPATGRPPRRHQHREPHPAALVPGTIPATPASTSPSPDSTGIAIQARSRHGRGSGTGRSKSSRRSAPVTSSRPPS